MSSLPSTQTVDPFLAPATTFLATVPIPPIWLLLIASISGCLLNGLLNYFLARASEVALLSARDTHSWDSHQKNNYEPSTATYQVNYDHATQQLGTSHNNDAHNGTDNSSFSRYGTLGASSLGTNELGLKATRAYERHVAFATAARRHWKQRHPQHDDEDGEHHPSIPLNPFKETDSLLTNDQLHYPASPIPSSSGAYGSAEEAMEAVLNSSAPTQTVPAPQIYVTPTTTQAQSFAMAGGAAPPARVEAVVAAANLQSTLREIRLEAQYVMFDTNRFFLLSSTIKCLCMVVYLHYTLNIPGGWKRFTVATGIALISGLLTPLIELLCAALLPSDSEVEDSRRRRAREEEADKEKADTVLVVELVLRYCTYDFKDLTTVFIQNAVFVLFGTVFVPPLVGFCFVSFFAYLWLFTLPLMVVYYARRQYYREQPAKKDGSPETTIEPRRSVRLQGLLELLKCVALKSFIIFLCLWAMQTTFVLAMATKEGRSYWDAIALLLDLQFNRGIGSYLQEIASNGTFWRIAVASQLLL